MFHYRLYDSSEETAYMQLYHQLRRDITGGVYARGDRLPSKRMLARETGCSVITVQHAYDLLIDEGYVSARERSGFYVSFSDSLSPGSGSRTFPPDRVPDPAKEAKNEADVSPDISFLFPFPSFARTMRRVLSEYGEKILIKSPGFGIPELRASIASYLGRARGILVRPDQIVIGSGAEYLYMLIVQMLGREGVYALEDPSYPQIRKVYEANGARCEMLKMGNDGIASEALAGSTADVLHVTPFHSYPSGVTASASKRGLYIAWAHRRNAMIIEDDADSEFSMSAKAEDTLFSLDPDVSVIYMNTFSRTAAPSMRLGYMVLPGSLSEKLKEKIAFYSCTVPVYDQYVLAEFISSGDFERHINRVRRYLRTQRAHTLR